MFIGQEAGKKLILNNMKYNDIATKKWNEKQLDKQSGYDPFFNSRDRAWRRERERELKGFGYKVKEYVESAWWDSFTTEERMGISMRWRNYKNSSYLTPEQSKGQFKTWIQNEFTRIKPDKEKYRDNKLDKMLYE
jgi:hypothetical protein